MKTPHPVDVHIGKRIRLARMEKSISQEKLGEGLGLTFQQVQKYEKGANRVGGSRMWEISKILGTPVSFFYEGLDPSASRDDAIAGEVSERTAFMATSEGLKLAKRFQAIESADTRRAVLALLATFGPGTGAGA